MHVLEWNGKHKRLVTKISSTFCSNPSRPETQHIENSRFSEVCRQVH